MKRLTYSILLCLLLGVVTSVGVAWGCAWFYSRLSSPMPGRVYAYTPYEGAVPWVIWCQGTGGYWDASRSPGHGFGAAGMTSLVTIPSWLTRDYSEEGYFRNTRFGIVFEHELAAGWPMPCVSSRVEFMPRGGCSVSRGIRIGHQSMRKPFVLPFDPILSGVLANTAIYGSVWFALLFGTGMFIRQRRRGAGRCVKCGYDLRGSSPTSGGACPECGKER